MGTIALEPGVAVNDKYRVVRMIGAGGSAAVYEVEHLALGRRAAIKVVCSEVDSGKVLERFQREARTCGQLRHPNIAEVYDVGNLDPALDGEGAPFLVMELLEGESLEERMQRGRIPLPLVVEIALQILAGLDAVHRAGSLHRDIKPHNVMLHRNTTGEIVPKLVDFGISKPIGKPACRNITEEGLIIGTPHYMSPEQARGLDLDARTDIYSLGVVLYEMVTGAAPFDEPTVTGLLTAVLRDPVQPPQLLRHECPDGLQDIILKAMSRTRDERYANAREMAQALEDFAEAQGYPTGADAWNAPVELERRKSMPPPQERSVLPPVRQTPPSTRESGTSARRFGVAPTMGANSALAETMQSMSPPAAGARMPSEDPPPSSVPAARATPPILRALPFLSPKQGLPAWLRRRHAWSGPLAGLAAACVTLAVAWGLTSSEPAEVISTAAAAVPAPQARPALGVIERIEVTRAPQSAPSSVTPLAAPAPASHAEAGVRSRPAASSAPTFGSPPSAPPPAQSPSSSRDPIARALARAPDPPPPANRDSYSEQLADEALAAYVRGQLPRARLLYRRAVAADSRNAAAWRGLGIVERRLGGENEAVTALRRYIELRPYAPDAPRIREILASMGVVIAPPPTATARRAL